jgi:hypothetical protein
MKGRQHDNLAADYLACFKVQRVCHDPQAGKKVPSASTVLTAVQV